LFLGLAALILNDLAQRGIDILGHSAGLAADGKVRAFTGLISSLSKDAPLTARSTIASGIWVLFG
jgi:hypothetical protein